MVSTKNQLHKKSSTKETKKSHLIEAIQRKVTTAKPIARYRFIQLIKSKRATTIELEKILKTVKVSRDGLDITFKY
jgi:hypothetical protein